MNVLDTFLKLLLGGKIDMTTYEPTTGEIEAAVKLNIVLDYTKHSKNLEIRFELPSGVPVCVEEIKNFHEGCTVKLEDCTLINTFQLKF